MGAGNCVTLCDLGVFVDQAAEPGLAHNAYSGHFRRPICTSGGRVLQERPVWPVRVVVIDILAQDQPQVPFADDQHSVQALAAGAGDPAFGNRVRTRRPDRRLDSPRADCSEYRVERDAGLCVPVTDQELQALSIILKVHQQVPGLLGHPRARGMSGDPGQVHAPGAVLDEEQHVQAAQEHRVDVEEIRREDRLRLPG